MTREEEVRAAIDKIFPCTNEGRCYEQAIGASGFELGVKWADKHPKNVWHDASEEPEKHSPILIESINTLTSQNEIGYYVEYAEEWIIGLMKTEGFKCRWAYISDLLPKGGEL